MGALLCCRFKIVPQAILEEMTLYDAHFGLFKDHIFSNCVAQGLANGCVPPLASATSSGSGSSELPLHHEPPGHPDAATSSGSKDKSQPQQ